MKVISSISTRNYALGWIQINEIRAKFPYWTTVTRANFIYITAVDFHWNCYCFNAIFILSGGAVGITISVVTCDDKVGIMKTLDFLWSTNKLNEIITYMTSCLWVATGRHRQRIIALDLTIIRDSIPRQLQSMVLANRRYQHNVPFPWALMGDVFKPGVIGRIFEGGSCWLPRRWNRMH